MRLGHLLLCLAGPAFADEKTPIINSVTEAATSVTIQGANFTQKKGQLQAFLSRFATPLSVLTYTHTTIVALLPANGTPARMDALASFFHAVPWPSIHVSRTLISSSHATRFAR